MPKTDQVCVIRHKAMNERVSIPQAAREMGVSRNTAPQLREEGCRVVFRVEPFGYLRDISVRITDHPIKRIEELIPPAWKQADAQS